MHTGAVCVETGKPSMVQTAVAAAAKQAVPQRTKQHIILCLYCMQQVVRKCCAADEAMDAGAQVAICSTSNEKAVQKIVDVMLPEAASRIRVFAGDIVPRKKPDPAIYMLAAKELGVQPSRYTFCFCRT